VAVRPILAIALIGLMVAASCSGPGTGSDANPSSPLATEGATQRPQPRVAATAGGPQSSPSPSTPAAAETEVPVTSPNPFALTSPAFEDGTAIPRAATCDGADASPALDWTGAPFGTQSLALVVVDPDARDFTHWIAFDFSGAPDGHLAAGVTVSATGLGQGRNDFGDRGYGGPCPPSGQHRYRFTLYALDRSLGIGGTPSLATVRAAMKGHVLTQVTLTGTYRRS